ncbi:hypothetical protein [Klebsiella pneumoniae]|uniref:hypothetical protein n=1 Tax=Klebsiella pneumoniae TaxID=573 RepID=UPI00058F1693|nr:hypothetical protein [Klebsiella pneumoniae]MEB7560053.1 hypothetical protein [Klebsiella pneumoniae]MEB7698566.1 hypothetical protein [Klebsiella pneumoniae]
MTITLQAVNDLIASLESAGELSIREQKFLNLAKAFKQLAAENVALKQFPEQIVQFISRLGTSEIGSDTKETIGLAASRIKTPATDRIVAGIKADAIDEAAVELDRVDTVASTRVIGFKLREFAQQLREGADK